MITNEHLETQIMSDTDFFQETPEETGSCRKSLIKKKEYRKQKIQKKVEIKNSNDSRNLLRQVNNLRAELKSSTFLYKNKQGAIISDINQVLQQWFDNFDEYLNGT